MIKTVGILLLSSLLIGQVATAAKFSGEFAVQSQTGIIRLSLEQNDAGFVSGVMSDGVSNYRLLGRRDGETASGKIKTDYPPDLGFTVKFAQSANQLVLQMYPMDAAGSPVPGRAQNLVFDRVSGSAVDSAETGDTAMQPDGNTGGNSNVYINGQALTKKQVGDFERQYQTRLIGGRYWYDDKCGAWGLEGGPTIGIILPSLPLPGPMPENISGGGTGIFINGREVHPADRQALIAMFGTAIPGRYWLDRYGNLGIEGGGVLVNLVVAAQQLQQKTTHSGYGSVSTGPEGAMFSGTNLSTGKPTFWYSGM
jgi:hypothetical protein